MKTIAIISQKGGTGKTTLALNLAVAAKLDQKPSVLVDLDPQASACGWGDLRSQETPSVVSAQAARLKQILSAAKDAGGKFVVIDTAPQSEKGALEAARQADLVLAPCRPALLDLNAIQHTFDLARLANKTCHVVLTQVPHQGSLGDQAEQLIKAQSTSVCPVRVGQRAAFVHAITSGQGVQEYDPQSKAAEEAQALYQWVCKKVK